MREIDRHRDRKTEKERKTEREYEVEQIDAHQSVNSSSISQKM